MPIPTAELSIAGAALLIHTLGGFVGDAYAGPKYLAYCLSSMSLAVVLIRDYFFVPCMFLPSIIMNNTSESRRKMLGQLRDRFKEIYPDNTEYIKIKTSDNLLLDGVVYTNPDHITIPYSKRKWILWMNPNGATYEEFLEFYDTYSRAVGVSVVGFNYRGVLRSEGRPYLASDLVRDGEAAMEYLLSHGVPSENILIHGHSMGGGVGAVVRSKYPDGPVINDRSFSSLHDTIQSLVKQEKALGILVGALLGFCGGFVAGGTYHRGYGSAFGYGFLSAVACGLIGYRKIHVFEKVLSALVAVLGWRLDVASCWHLIRGYKVIIYHQLDGMIEYNNASLHSALAKVKETPENSSRTETKYVKLNYTHYERNQALTDPHQIYHVYGLDTIKAEWELIVAEARRALHIK